MLHFEAIADRMVREHNERVWLAYHVAALPRLKKFPDMKKLLAREESARQPQSPDHQWAILSAMAEASKVLRKN